MKHSILLKVIPAAALVGAVASHSAPAEAQSRCTSGTRVVSDLAANYSEQLAKWGCKGAKDPAACLEKAKKVEEVIRASIKKWNELAGNSWATIGPRELVFQGKMDGKVVLGSERLFVTKAPVFEGDSVRVEVLKEGGKADTRVTLAMFDESGKCLEGDEVVFGGKDKKGTKRNLKLSGISGKYLAVKVNAKGGKAFDYELRATLSGN
ncbi:MAG: hypothetical protein R3B13_12490 [Polyangiaceae bacterium]